ncbi:MAG TPA: 2-oxo acid dehydrogenase subunit E2, partial [Mycobacteriales bacterium]|nr:2-oxo acid dehydrogenase subunit E2 [Mycobacteriales bacterium]
GQQPAASQPSASQDTAASGRQQIAQPAQRTDAPAPAFVDQAVKAAPDTSVRGRTEPMSRLRKVIAERMVESLQVSAQLTTVVEVDVTKIARLRQQAKASFEQREGVKLSFMPFFAQATLEALKQHPVVNASVDQEGGRITYHDDVHLGVAVDTERGLLVPVIHGAGDLNLAGLAKKIADLAGRTRTNKVTPDELGGGTFTLTNTGSRGALFDTPIINQPQVGILGTGAVVKRPVVVDDPELGEVVAVRSMVYLALTYDHRIVDGADAARFLVTVKERLEEGDFAAELGL